MSIYRLLSRHILYPAYEKFSGRQFLEKLRFLEQSQWWDGTALARYQWKHLKFLLNYAYINNSFYRRKFEEYGVHPDEVKDFGDFSRIPLLTKEDVGAHLPELISKTYTREMLLRDQTSGSTGRNLVFYNDRNTLDWMTAAVLRNMNWYQVDFGDKRVLLWGSLLNDARARRTYMHVRNLLLREYLISSYELDAARLASVACEIQRLQPKALIGYVSALEILARFLQKNGPGRLEIPAVVPAAETLFEHQRELFEKVFACQVFNRYGCHEFNGIAHECGDHSGMHVNAENLYVEVLNDGRPAGPGETGELVITDLSNFGAPFIRYKIGDVGKFAPGRCSCGRALPLLESVEGRVYDLIACPNGTVQTGTFFCKVTRSFEGIQEFQVIQESDQRIRLKLVTEDKFESESVVSIRNMIKVHCGEEMDVAFEFVDRLEPLKSGKRRYIVSLASASGGEPPSYTLQARKNNHG